MTKNQNQKAPTMLTVDQRIEDLEESVNRMDALIQQLKGEVEPLLTLAEAAAMLKVHERTVTRWMEEGRLPRVKLGQQKHSALRFKRSDVVKLIEESAA